jgi:hypothetical protein
MGCEVPAPPVSVPLVTVALPAEAITGEPVATPLSKSWTLAPVVAATVKIGVVTLVRLSVLDVPESLAAVRSGVPTVTVGGAV